MSRYKACALSLALYLGLANGGLAEDEPAGRAVPRGTGVDLASVWPMVGKLRQSQVATLELWLRPDKLTIGRERAMVFLLAEERGADVLSVGLALHKGVPHAGVLGAYLKGGAALPPDRWAHLALTLDGKSARLWVNGLPVARAKWASPWPPAFPVAALAQDPWHMSRDFSGALGDVRISDRVRYKESFRPSSRLAADASTVHRLEGGKIRPTARPAVVRQKPGSIRAFFFRDGAPVELTPLGGAVPPGKKPLGLADLPLVLKEPCLVTTGGRTFRLDQEGLYRIGNLATRETANAILYRGDLWRFIGHLSRLQVHGWRHDGEGALRWTERARKGRLSITCGNITSFVMHHLAAQKHRSRVVQLVTLEEHNGYDDGHVLMEVFDPREKRWILYDPDMKCRFKHAGRYLSLAEAVALYRKGELAELELFCQPAIDTYAEEGGSREHAQYSLLFEWAFRDAAGRQAWYRRMLQVPIINGAAGALKEADVARIRATGFGKPVRWEEWKKSAYGK